MEIFRETVRKLAFHIYAFFEKQNARYMYRQSIKSGILSVGKYTYGLPRVDTYRGGHSSVMVGSYCSISRDVVFVNGGIHPAGWISTFPLRARLDLEGGYSDGMPYSKGDIVVGSDVWIGSGATILSGVNVGHGAIIAAGSMVTNDIPAYAIAAGVPARVIRHRFTDQQIENLLRIEWWGWDDIQVKDAAHLLSSDRIDEFIDAYAKVG